MSRVSSLPRAVSVAFQTDKPLAAYGPLAAAVEAHGFDGVTVYSDLLYQPPWLPLLEIARATRRVRIGPAAVNPFTCHPLEMAGHVALLDEASGGRARPPIGWFGGRPDQPDGARVIGGAGAAGSGALSRLAIGRR